MQYKITTKVLVTGKLFSMIVEAEKMTLLDAQELISLEVRKHFPNSFINYTRFEKI